MATVSVRYIVEDVDAAIDFYREHLAFTLEVSDLAATARTLRDAGVKFRNDIVTGVGGKQVLIEDPSGNLIELFEPTIPAARLAAS